MTAGTRPATDAELESWDALAVDAPGGHVLQSRAWAEHRGRGGWRPRFLVTSDGGRVLALVRSWPVIPGGSAYVPRGPAPVDADGTTVARRAIETSDALAAEGVDVVAVDAEVPEADTGYLEALRAGGFAPIEEIQPSRHRVSLPLGDADEGLAFGHLAKSTRQRIRAAESEGLAVVRHDVRMAGGAGEGFTAAAGPDTTPALDRFYDLLLATGERRQFTFGPRPDYLAWWGAAHAAGHLVHLEIRGPGPEAPAIAGLMLYRHGTRLSTVHSADLAETRHAHPGALHLARWRAIQLAIREGRDEMDLGGADVAGARREPREGEPMWGLYQHKRSFGGEWLALAGAHERVIRPRRYAAGRVAARIRRAIPG